MLTFIVTHVYFPPVPALLALVSLWILLFKRPKHWLSALIGIPILSFIHANVFPIYLARTLSSILLAVSATVLPCLVFALVLQRLSGVTDPNRETLSDAKPVQHLFLMLAGAAMWVALATYTPEHCFTAKCKISDALFGPRLFANFWLASLVGGLHASGAFLALQRVVMRALRR